MYANANGLIVQDNEQYIGINGKQHAASHPKNLIPELTLVTETAPPTDENLKVTGFTLDGSYNQAWTTVAKTQEEVDFDLADAKTNRKLFLDSAYRAACQEDIPFTASGSSEKIYQADEESIKRLQKRLDAYPTTTPVGFYWRSKDNTNVPFTRADLEELVTAIVDRDDTLSQALHTKKDTVDDVGTNTIALVNAVV